VYAISADSLLVLFIRSVSLAIGTSAALLKIKRIIFSSTTPLTALHPNYRDLTPTFASGRSRWRTRMSLERRTSTHGDQRVFFGS